MPLIRIIPATSRNKIAESKSVMEIILAEPKSAFKSFLDLPVQPHHNHEHIRRQHRRQPKRAEYLLSQHPLLLILQSLEEKVPERIRRIRPGQALIKLLVILVRSEPEFVRVQEEHQAEQQEDEHKTERDFRHCEEA